MFGVRNGAHRSWYDLVKQAIKDLAGVGKADDEPKLNGRFIIVNLSPLPKNQRILATIPRRS